MTRRHAGHGIEHIVCREGLLADLMSATFNYKPQMTVFRKPPFNIMSFLLYFRQ